jgi:hypothetical protein
LPITGFVVIVMPDAFNQAINSQGKGFPLLWVHDQETPLGIAKIRGSKEGLIVDGQMLMADPNAQRIHGHMLMGSVRGMSIGFGNPDPARLLGTKTATGYCGKLSFTNSHCVRYRRIPLRRSLQSNPWPRLSASCSPSAANRPMRRW